MSAMHNPPHPGEVLKDGVFADHKITVTAFAERIGISRVMLSRVLNCRAGVTADMAVRLATVLGTSAEVWLQMQSSYDLWRARQALKKVVAKIRPLTVTA